MRLVTPAHDPWHRLSGEDGPHPHPNPCAHALLTLEQWHAVRGQWAQALPAGIEIPNTLDVQTLAGDLPRLGLIALQFPKWTNGRAYTQARLLRSRLGFTGEIRATGDVVADMLPLLQRTGFDAAALRADQRPETARRALGFFAGHYQGDVVQAQPLFGRSAI